MILSILLVSLLGGNDYPVQPVLFTQVRLHDDFWAPRIETNRKVTIPYAFSLEVRLEEGFSAGVHEWRVE